MEATFWALVPPIVAIIISLITKEVNLSLFLGIAVGSLLYTKGNIFSATFLLTDKSLFGEKENIILSAVSPFVSR